MKYQDVVVPQSKNAIMVTLTIKREAPLSQTVDAIRDLCDRLPAVIHSMKLQHPEGRFCFAMGIGARAWQRLFPKTKPPKGLHVFEQIKGPKKTAVSTPGDLFFHVRADTMDICYQIVTILHKLLKDVSEPVDETHGFRYRDGRAIIGFVDGTENPHEEEAPLAAYIGSEDEEYAGGSYVFTQKYEHDMEYWEGLSQEEQERSIGRRKWDDLELDDDDKLINAHTQVSKAHDKNGEELKIVRANISYAQPSENLFGTYFIGYSKDFAVTRQMLEHMFLGDPAGNTDRLLDFSTPVTGALYFVPSFDTLDKIAAGEIE